MSFWCVCVFLENLKKRRICFSSSFQHATHGFALWCIQISKNETCYGKFPAPQKKNRLPTHLLLKFSKLLECYGAPTEISFARTEPTLQIESIFKFGPVKNFSCATQLLQWMIVSLVKSISSLFLWHILVLKYFFWLHDFVGPYSSVTLCFFVCVSKYLPKKN